MNDQSIKFNLVEDINLRAHFESVPLEFSYWIENYDDFNLTNSLLHEYSISSSSGFIDTESDIRHGDLIELAFIPNYGHQFKHWIIDDQNFSQNVYTLTALRNSTVKAVTFLKQFELSLNPKSGTIKFNTNGGNFFYI